MASSTGPEATVMRPSIAAGSPLRLNDSMSGQSIDGGRRRCLTSSSSPRHVAGERSPPDTAQAPVAGLRRGQPMSTAPPSAPEVLTFGRSGVDIYPLQTGVGLEDVETFGKFLGGTTANVAVAASRLGRRTAIITGVGEDPFGHYVRRELRRLGVDDAHVVVDPHHLTPVTFCEIFPPDDFPLWFYRRPTAPDLQVRTADVDLDAARDADLLWLSVTGLSEEPSRQTHHDVLAARGGRDHPGHTVLDLDCRRMFWPDPAAATTEVGKVLGQVTVAVGNREECEVAVGETEPERAADALLDAGVQIAVVKQGPRGVLAKNRDGRRVEAPPIPVIPLNGLGAG